ncbi:FAD-dependent oxidoreductase [Myxococcota bacterium]|nr:FAD-dependent oxidoreductase [Myxococcota bacterium]
MSESVHEISAAEFPALRASKKALVVDFYSTECPPCEALASKYDAVAELFHDDVEFVKIFRQGNRELATELGVKGSPTVLFFKDGQEVGHRLTSAIKRSELLEGVRELEPAERFASILGQVQPSELDVDVLILGAGPAGVTAAIYCAQARLKTVMVDLGLGGGNVATTHQVSNFPGFPKPMPGYLLADHMVEQAKAAGVIPRLAAEVTGVDIANKTVVLDGVETIRARRMVIATGSSPRVIGVKGEREFKGRGVSYCATCDAKYQEGKHVVVIGGGNSAIEESLFIARFADRITIVNQFPDLQANQHAQEQARAEPKIRFRLATQPREFLSRSGRGVDGVLVEDLVTHERSIIDCDAVFVFAGMVPNLDQLQGVFQLDAWGYIATDDEMRTSVPGVFAIGDVSSKKFRQITTAVADGTIASMAIARDLAS